MTTQHFNPVDHIKGQDPHADIAGMLESIRKLAADFWDVAIVDINLLDVNLPKADRVQLSINIAKHIREVNRAAIVFLYSGTLEKHIETLLSDAKATELTLKNIFHSEISGFVPRGTIKDEVYSSLDQPPWLLLIDRMLTKYGSLAVGPKESEFFGLRFLDLAIAVRMQDKIGKRVAELAAEFGVASLAELNS